MKKPTTKTSQKKLSIAPLGDRVLVRPFTMEEVSGNKHFGIILPDSASKEKSAQGEVLAVGPGRHHEGNIIPVNVKVGDIVVFSKYAYDEVEMDGEELYLLREDNLLAVIKN
ncbi:MAG: molecular chaperone GroES [Parcubacteria group bacterium]|nr:molecular chaperone GroES [Parcubacteria group bacterium]